MLDDRMWLWSLSSFEAGCLRESHRHRRRHLVLSSRSSWYPGSSKYSIVSIVFWASRTWHAHTIEEVRSHIGEGEELRRLDESPGLRMPLRIYKCAYSQIGRVKARRTIYMKLLWYKIVNIFFLLYFILKKGKGRTNNFLIYFRKRRKKKKNVF